MTEIKVKVVLIEIGMPGKVVEIENTKHAAEVLLDSEPGTLEPVPIGPKIWIWCNKNAKELGMPANLTLPERGYAIYGKILVTAQNRLDSAGQFVSLSDDQVTIVLKFISECRRFVNYLA